MRKMWVILLVSAFTAAASEMRTWTFGEDGEMRSPSGGTWSFKKNGRVDAAFMDLQGTNVVLIADDATRRILPVKYLSESDRAYVEQASGTSEPEVAVIEQRAAIRNSESMRTADVARMKSEAAIKRRAAAREIEAACKLENEASRCASRAGNLEVQADHAARAADRIESSAVVSPRAGLADVNARGASAIKVGAADRLEDHMLELQREASEKRVHARQLQMEASNLERTAYQIEFGQAPRPSVKRPGS